MDLVLVSSDDSDIEIIDSIPGSQTNNDEFEILIIDSKPAQEIIIIGDSSNDKPRKKRKIDKLNQTISENFLFVDSQNIPTTPKTPTFSQKEQTFSSQPKEPSRIEQLQSKATKNKITMEIKEQSPTISSSVSPTTGQKTKPVITDVNSIINKITKKQIKEVLLDSIKSKSYVLKNLKYDDSEELSQGSFDLFSTLNTMFQNIETTCYLDHNLIKITNTESNNCLDLFSLFNLFEVLHRKFLNFKSNDCEKIQLFLIKFFQDVNMVSFKLIDLSDTKQINRVQLEQLNEFYSKLQDYFSSLLKSLNQKSNFQINLCFLKILFDFYRVTSIYIYELKFKKSKNWMLISEFFKFKNEFFNCLIECFTNFISTHSKNFKYFQSLEFVELCQIVQYVLAINLLFLNSNEDIKLRLYQMTNFMVEIYNNIESDQGKNLFLERIIVSNELKMKLCTKILSGTSISHLDEQTKIIENLNDLILTEQLDALKHNVAILELYLRLFYYFRTKINENSFLLSLFDLDDQGPKFSESIKNLSTFIRDRILNDSFLSENCDLSQDLYEDLLYIV